MSETQIVIIDQEALDICQEMYKKITKLLNHRINNLNCSDHRKGYIAKQIVTGVFMETIVCCCEKPLNELKIIYLDIKQYFKERGITE